MGRVRGEDYLLLAVRVDESGDPSPGALRPPRCGWRPPRRTSAGSSPRRTPGNPCSTRSWPRSPASARASCRRCLGRPAASRCDGGFSAGKSRLMASRSPCSSLHHPSPTIQVKNWFCIGLGRPHLLDSYFFFSASAFLTLAGVAGRSYILAPQAL